MYCGHFMDTNQLNISDFFLSSPRTNFVENAWSRVRKTQGDSGTYNKSKEAINLKGSHPKELKYLSIKTNNLL